MQIQIHDAGHATVERREHPAGGLDEAFAVSILRIGNDVIRLFHGIEEDPLDTKKGESNE